MILLKNLNKQLCAGVKQYDDIMLLADTKKWAVDLDYNTDDLLNAVYIFDHVASNIGIKNGHIDEAKAVEFGNRLRELVKDMTGYDTREIATKK